MWMVWICNHWKFKWPIAVQTQLLLTTARRGSGNSSNTTIDNLWQTVEFCIWIYLAIWQAAISATGSSTDVVALVDDAPLLLLLTTVGFHKTNSVDQSQVYSGHIGFDQSSQNLCSIGVRND